MDKDIFFTLKIGSEIFTNHCGISKNLSLTNYAVKVNVVFAVLWEGSGFPQVGKRAWSQDNSKGLGVIHNWVFLSADYAERFAKTVLFVQETLPCTDVRVAYLLAKLL